MPGLSEIRDIVGGQQLPGLIVGYRSKIVGPIEVTIPNPASNYGAGDRVGPASGYGCTEIPNCAAYPGGGGHIYGVLLETNKAGLTAQMVVYFFKADGAQLAIDNAPYKELYVDKAIRSGSWRLPAMTSEGTGTDMSKTADMAQRLAFTCMEESTSLWFALKTLSILTSPTNAQKFALTLFLEQS